MKAKKREIQMDVKKLNTIVKSIVRMEPEQLTQAIESMTVVVNAMNEGKPVHDKSIEHHIEFLYDLAIL